MKTKIFFLSLLFALISMGACEKDNDSGPPHLRKHTYHADYVHNPQLDYGSVIDQEGNSYKTMIIGSQEWMAENLKTSSYRNGNPIPNVQSKDEWVQLDAGAWVHYDNNVENECPYGKLYNWYAVSDNRGLCPTGWRVPTDDDWDQLTDHLGDLNSAGAKMKSAGTVYWAGENSGAVNSSGFSGLPGGSSINGDFNEIGKHGRWWSSTKHPTFGSAYYRQLNYHLASLKRHDLSQYQGFSVRCIRE